MRKEHPILFSTPMVQAILEGKKAKTRRIIKHQPIIDQDSGFVFDGKHRKQYDIHNWQERFIDDFAKWMPDDWLWVRETYSWDYKEYPERTEKFYYYKANTSDNFLASGEKWKPSIFMPRVAARIFLEVTNVKVERLHDISDADIISEGVRVPVSEEGGVFFKLGVENSAYRFMPEQWQIDRHVENRGKEIYTPTEHDLLFAHWAELWCEINGRESWDANPWLWVIEFKVLSTTGKPLFKKLADVETV
ncbi:MAG: hypothetical protein E6H09_23520 [Bacteroidetes bacterium]|nr:MAG: hypothetical protein E6H09_23520 [Bacteroidota bacterium]